MLSLGNEACLDFWGSLEEAKADCADADMALRAVGNRTGVVRICVVSFHCLLLRGNLHPFFVCLHCGTILCHVDTATAVA